MKFAWIVYCLASLFVGSGVELGGPTNADFLPTDSQRSFPSARGLQYWGTGQKGWHIALRPEGAGPTFIPEGGGGEELRVRLTVFIEDGDWPRWGNRAQLGVRLCIKAEGLEDFVASNNARPVVVSGNDHGTCWIVNTKIRLHELRDHWRRLPANISLLATVVDQDLPRVSTAAMPVQLTAVSLEYASWKQRVNSLRAGQSREEIDAILGTPTSTRTFTDFDGKPRMVLIYPNPDAPEKAKPEERTTLILLDARGCYSAYRHTWNGGC